MSTSEPQKPTGPRGHISPALAKAQGDTKVKITFILVSGVVIGLVIVTLTGAFAYAFITDETFRKTATPGLLQIVGTGIGALGGFHFGKKVKSGE
jgi:amino acid permease